MVRRVSVSEARAGLPQLLDRVIEGEEVTITRHGKAVAVVVRPDVLRARRAEGAWAAAEHIADLLAESRHRPLTLGPTLTADRAEVLVEGIRADRAAR